MYIVRNSANCKNWSVKLVNKFGEDAMKVDPRLPLTYAHAGSQFLCTSSALPLLFVPGHLSSHRGCIGGVEKAHRELQFAWRRSQTPEIRCSRNAHSELRQYAIQFKYVDETVAVNGQCALCWSRDHPDSFTTTLANSY